MKIKMLEWFQGTELPTLLKGEEYLTPKEVSDELANWLIDNRKAVKVIEPKKKVEQPEEQPQEAIEEPVEAKEEPTEVTDEDFAEMLESKPVEKKVESKVRKPRRKK